MFETSTIELSKSALKNNIGFIKKRLNKGVRFCSVVKGNAYGHGLTEYVQLAMELGIDYFAVHASNEAYELVTNLTKRPDIFIMGAIDGNAVDWAIENEIEFSVFDFERLNHAIEIAKSLGKPAKIHIELETGMHRTGFEISQINHLCEILVQNITKVKIFGLFTHFAGAESQANHFRIVKQKELFDQMVKILHEATLSAKYVHTCCSAALLNYPEYQGNMVRVGILQFGFWPNKETQVLNTLETEKEIKLLKRIIRWRTSVMSVKEVKKGDFIGYGTSYLALKHLKIAVIPVGYSHGYARNLSNIGSVLINGKEANIIGTINMNSLSVDVSHCGQVVKGSQVILIGTQNKKSISVNSFSEQSQLLNYELLTRLPLDIPRIIVQ